MEINGKGINRLRELRTIVLKIKQHQHINIHICEVSWYREHVIIIRKLRTPSREYKLHGIAFYGIFVRTQLQPAQTSSSVSSTKQSSLSFHFFRNPYSFAPRGHKNA